MTAAVSGGHPVRLQRYSAASVGGRLHPDQRAMRLLEKTGFQRKGYAREYLCINGSWQDHVLYARPASDST
jgi:ribosomal-protein-alanine N-acetyltransferase